MPSPKGFLLWRHTGWLLPSYWLIYVHFWSMIISREHLMRSAFHHGFCSRLLRLWLYLAHWRSNSSGKRNVIWLFFRSWWLWCHWSYLPYWRCLAENPATASPSRVLPCGSALLWHSGFSGSNIYALPKKKQRKHKVSTIHMKRPKKLRSVLWPFWMEFFYPPDLRKYCCV